MSRAAAASFFSDALTLRQVCRAGFAGRGTASGLSRWCHSRRPSLTRDLVSGQDDYAGVRAAAHRVRERDACAGHLARPRRAAELPGELDDLAEGRGAERLALGEEATRGVDRQL